MIYSDSIYVKKKIYPKKAAKLYCGWNQPKEVHPANEYLQYFHATLYNGPGGVVPAEAGIQSKCRSCYTDLSTQGYSPLLISFSRPVPTSGFPPSRERRFSIPFIAGKLSGYAFAVKTLFSSFQGVVPPPGYFAVLLILFILSTSLPV